MRLNLLTEDTHLFGQLFQKSGPNDIYIKFVKISRRHSAGLLAYSLITIMIFLELVIVLIMHRAKGGIGGKTDFLFVQERW